MIALRAGAQASNDASQAASLVLSADGHWLATSGGDDVRVFDTSTWRQAVTIAGPRARSLSFDPSGPVSCSPPIGPEYDTTESLVPDQRFIALSCRTMAPASGTPNAASCSRICRA